MGMEIVSTYVKPRHMYMMIRLANGKFAEVDCYVNRDGTKEFFTSGWEKQELVSFFRREMML